MRISTKRDNNLQIVPHGHVELDHGPINTAPPTEYEYVYHTQHHGSVTPKTKSTTER